MSACVKVSTLIEAIYAQFAFWRSTDVFSDNNTGHLKLYGIDPHSGGLHFVVAITINSSGYEDDGHTYHPDWEGSDRRYLHIIITRWHNLFCAVGKSHALSDIPMEDWLNLSNHDSCWNSSMESFISENWFAAVDKAQAMRPEEFRKAPIYFSDSAELSLTWFRGNVFQYVEIEKGEKTDSYHYALKAIKLFKIKTIELEAV